MKEKVIAVFDIGKTNKKILLFDLSLGLVAEEEEKLPVIADDDGFECDDIDRIEKWITDSLERLATSDVYDLKAVNFATYGASLGYLDSSGKRVGYIYDYLRPIDEKIPEKLYSRYGGQDEFSRRTASPALGMLNSGMQILWLRKEKPALFNRVKHILHFPQYLSYLVSGKICSEHTSIGCHTALWDFDNMDYHPWVKDEGISLPPPVPVSTCSEVNINGKKILCGTGIHDSSSSLAPYFSDERGKFLLVSSGTWCINMNPFNTELLTSEQLDRDCLCYLSINRKPVKSSRLFLGHLHETAVSKLNIHFRTSEDYFRNITTDKELLKVLRSRYSGDRRIFFESGPESREFRDRINLYEFLSFEEAYHQLMIELSYLATEAIKLVLPEKDDTDNIYITGGFSRNKLFLSLISEAFPAKKVYTSEIQNATALGAALVLMDAIEPGKELKLNLGLNEC